MLYEYLVERYQPNEPIFLSDINLDISEGNLRQMFKTLCDNGKLERFDKGIYYLPKASRLKSKVPLGTDIVMKYKYICRNGKVDGYYTGFTFANQLGITTQVPFLIEIVSNNASARVREINLKGRRILLRKARVEVDESNYRVLQFLDLLKDIDLYADEENITVSECLKNYVISEGMTKQELDQYISLYPDKIYRNMYEKGLFNVFESR